jgi:transposase, IS5 family
MDRCWLKGAQGEALHAVLCAVGFNIRWLMRALLRQAQASGLKHIFLVLIALCQDWVEGVIAAYKSLAGPIGLLPSHPHRAGGFV